MFGWWRRLKARREYNRNRVYRFKDGRKMRTVDPCRVWHMLWNDEEVDLHNLIKDAEADPRLIGADTASEAMIQATDHVARVFGVQPIDDQGNGWTVYELYYDLLDPFLHWVDDLKKKQNSLQSPLPGSEPPVEDLPPPKNSDCSSTPERSTSSVPT